MQERPAARPGGLFLQVLIPAATLSAARSAASSQRSTDSPGNTARHHPRSLGRRPGDAQQHSLPLRFCSFTGARTGRPFPEARCTLASRHCIEQRQCRAELDALLLVKRRLRTRQAASHPQSGRSGPDLSEWGAKRIQLCPLLQTLPSERERQVQQAIKIVLTLPGGRVPPRGAIAPDLPPP